MNFLCLVEEPGGFPEVRVLHRLVSYLACPEKKRRVSTIGIWDYWETPCLTNTQPLKCPARVSTW